MFLKKVRKVRVVLALRRASDGRGTNEQLCKRKQQNKHSRCISLPEHSDNVRLEQVKVNKKDL